MIRLRYRLLPYIYSMAAAQTRGNYTMARPLAFDFPNDSTVLDLKDEYLFGSMLVCPVTHPMTETTTRSVYLPRGCQWYDYWTHRRYEGGQWLTVAVTIDRLPRFVKAGTIIPVSDVVEYSDAQKGKPVTALVFPGADASFMLYNDDGISYDYKKGHYQLTRLVWNDKQSKLTVKGPEKVAWRIVK